jgi:hypothetical protein
VGAGHSAATSVCNLARLAEDNTATWVIWLARCTSTQPIKRFPSDPLKERDRLAVKANTFATRPDANVEFHNQSFIEAIDMLGPDRGFRVTARCAGKNKTWEVERIIGNVGYMPDPKLSSELRDREPNYYVLGMKRQCRDPNFLLRNGFEQIRDVFRIITGKADLDLYKQDKRS